MKYLMLFAGAFVSYFIIGHALQCYNRPLEIATEKMEVIECNGTQQCFKRIGILPQHTIYIKGCLPSAICSISYSKKVEGITLDFRTLCCNTDLCNGSFRMKTSFMAGFVLAFGWFLWHL